MDIKKSLRFLSEVLLVVLIGSLVLFAFYWFAGRPYLVRKQCAAEAKIRYYPGAMEDANNAYRQCVAKKGLKPESLYVNWSDE